MGFSDISHKECFVIDRKITDDLNNQYPVSLIIGKASDLDHTWSG
jgi:hypothetical protein